MCGELVVACRVRGEQHGSSPRVRGTRHAQIHAVHVCRFIPACAGNSHQAAETACECAVHPRVCGELASQHLGHCPRRGSSPRVRGTPVSTTRPARPWRFIPACAGNSPPLELSKIGDIGSSPRVRGTRSPGRTPASARTVHPRVCGELEQAEHARQEIRRFIPACAGNSASNSTTATRTTGSSPRVRGTRGQSASTPFGSSVHPRVCGELVQHHDGRCRQPWFIPACAGNSHHAGRVEGIADRFIPACAGNSRPATTSTTGASVHPRVCGELARALAIRPFGVRFIPACAGNSVHPYVSARFGPVHPRVCGELVL